MSSSGVDAVGDDDVSLEKLCLRILAPRPCVMLGCAKFVSGGCVCAAPSRCAAINSKTFEQRKVQRFKSTD